MHTIFSKACYKQTCCHPDSVVPFIEYRKGSFCIIVKGPWIFIMEKEHWFSLKVTSYISPSKRISHSFETLKPGIGFSVAAKVLDGTFF